MGSMWDQCNPTVGINQIPRVGLGYVHTYPMRARDILGANVRALMAANKRLDTIKKVSVESGGVLSNGKVGRITAASHVTDVDAIGELARVFGVEPWQLLVPGLDPGSLPMLASPALLEQIRDLVRISPNQGSVLPVDTTAQQGVEQTLRKPAKIGPALQEGFDVKKVGNATSKSFRIQKSKGRGSA